MSHVNPVYIHVASFENRTTRTELRVGTSEYSAHFTCFLDLGMVLELPPRTCAKGHRVQVRLDIAHGGKLVHFPVAAQVQEVHSTPGEADSVTCLFVGYEKTDWEWIQALYQKRQNEVAGLFKKLRDE